MLSRINYVKRYGLVGRMLLLHLNHDMLDRRRHADGEVGMADRRICHDHCKLACHLRLPSSLEHGAHRRPDRLYVQRILAITDVLDRHAGLTHIRSVDEFQLALSGNAQTLDGIRQLVTTLRL